MHKNNVPFTNCKTLNSTVEEYNIPERDVRNAVFLSLSIFELNGCNETLQDQIDKKPNLLRSRCLVVGTRTKINFLLNEEL